MKLNYEVLKEIVEDYIKEHEPMTYRLCGSSSFSSALICELLIKAAFDHKGIYFQNADGLIEHANKKLKEKLQPKICIDNT